MSDSDTTSKRLLVIHSHGDSGERIVKSHWENYKLSGMDILGVNTVDKPFTWPEGAPSVNIGKDGGWRVSHSNLPNRLRDTIKTCLESDYDEFFITECDCMFFRPCPTLPGSITSLRAGGPCPKNWKVKCIYFYHPPWWMDRDGATLIEGEMGRLIDRSEFERGSPDLFFGLACERLKIKPTQPNTWSCNGDDFKNRVKQAFKAAESGIFFMHGVKEEHYFQQLLGYVKP